MKALTDAGRVSGPRRFKPYTAYTDSGIEWLGEVPAHWEVKKWRYCCHVTEGQVAPDDDRYRDRVMIAPNHIESGSGRILFTETADEQGAISGKYLVKPGDIIYSKIRPALNKACIATGDWLCSADMYPVKITANNLNSNFLLYFILSEPFVRLMVDESMRVAMPKVNRDKLTACPLPIPQLAEQEAIATFLDRETARIDALVGKKERLIELLQEKRSALITRAVTKGLNPNAPMKDSGVEWLGEIPSHWEAVRVKHALLDRMSGPFGSSLTKDSYGGSTYRVYGQEQVIPGDFTIGDYYIPEPKFLTMKRYAVQAGDVLLSCVGTFGRAAVVPQGIEPGIINPRLILLRPHRKVIVPGYLELFLKSELSFAQMDEMSRGGTMDIINLSTISALSMPLPPISEQNEILQAVKTEGERIDGLVTRVHDAIDHLRELRCALISAAVTGKIDVREETA